MSPSCLALAPRRSASRSSLRTSESWALMRSILSTALSPSGQRLSGKRVTLELIERRYSYAKESAGDDYRSLSKPIDRQLARCELTTGAEPATCGLAVPAAG